MCGDGRRPAARHPAGPARSAGRPGPRRRAALCIHQILRGASGKPARARGTGRASTWSPAQTPGEGKTTLPSAWHSRSPLRATDLLVDCDIVGQRLMRGLVRRPPGVAGRAGPRDGPGIPPTGRRRAVSARGGTSDVLDAAAVSSVACGRLLLDARRYFDVIIVDSGPILGHRGDGRRRGRRRHLCGLPRPATGTRGQGHPAPSGDPPHLRGVRLQPGTGQGLQPLRPWLVHALLRAGGRRGSDPAGRVETLADFGPLVRAVSS